MKEEHGKFLPAGSVVLLEGATKRLMITGFCTMAAEEAEGVMYDYSGCMYPEGMISSDQNALFNHDQIEIFSTCEYLIEEMLNYTFVLDKEGRPTKTPKDGKDHCITALEFVVAGLPHNLQELRLSAYIPQGTKFIHDKDLKER